MVIYANFPSETLFPGENLVPGTYFPLISPEEAVTTLLNDNWEDGGQISKTTVIKLLEEIPLSIDLRRANYVRISRLSGPVSASAIKASDEVYTIQCEYETLISRDEFDAITFAIENVIKGAHIYPTSNFQSVRVIRKHSDSHAHKRIWRGTIDVEVIKKWGHYGDGD